jgi:hypothetical protein
MVGTKDRLPVGTINYFYSSASWANVNLTGPKKEENSRGRLSCTNE